MFINFYSISAVSNLSNMLKCVLLLPSDCVYVRYYNEISSIINTIILQSRGRIVHCVVAKRPGGETSWGRNDQVANWRRGETSSYPHRIHGTFVPENFRSRERKFHRWNFRSLELSFPGTFVPWNFRPLELSFARVKLGWNFRSLTLIPIAPLT